VGALHTVEGPVLPSRRSTAVTATAAGLLGLLVVAGTAPSGRAGVAVVVGGLAMALFWGPVVWLSGRSPTRRLLGDLPVEDHAATGSTRSGVRRGLLLTALLAVVMLAWTVAATQWDGLTSSGTLVWGIFTGAGLLSALQARDLERWQEEHGLVLCLRAGAGLFTWTKAQARRELVLVPTAGARSPAR
jgi:hypothetical protein